MPSTVIYDEVFAHLHASVVILDTNFQILYMNVSAERLFAQSFSSCQRKPISNIFTSEENILVALQDVFKNGRSITIHETEVSILKKHMVLQLELAPIGLSENPSEILLLINELSTAQALQEESRLQDRLDMMGTMASGLAHEIRNPLGGIRGAAQMLNREQDAQEKANYIQMIINEVDRMNKLITELLDFSKPKRVKKASVNIHKTLSEILKLQNNALETQGIKLIKEFDPSLPAVYGHGPSLRQAFLNLIKNAIEAMHKGGTLKIKTQFHSQAKILRDGGSSAPLAEICIQDDGPGIPKNIQKSLFTPFFTTKNQGTGLGLMMVQRIAKEHGGAIKMESKPGQGTVFRLFLKLASPSAKD